MVLTLKRMLLCWWDSNLGFPIIFWTFESSGLPHMANFLYKTFLVANKTFFGYSDHHRKDLSLYKPNNNIFMMHCTICTKPLHTVKCLDIDTSSEADSGEAQEMLHIHRKLNLGRALVIIPRRRLDYPGSRPIVPCSFQDISFKATKQLSLL